ncbi:MAG: thiolase family protein, partial [Candidatus Xenobia bacterium]
ARTPMGKFGGTLRDVPVYEMGAVAIREAVARAGIAPELIGEVLIGCCRQAGNGTNPARTAARMAGIPSHISAVTITQACASGTRAVIFGSQLLRMGEAQFVVAGGMESMSTIPYLIKDARWQGFRLGNKTIIDGWDDSRDPFIDDIGTGQITENLVNKHHITRQEQDQFALESHQKAAAARAEGCFQQEIVPITVEDKTLTHDESIREDTSLEKLGRLRPSFRRDGTLTAGNSSGLTDGASAMVLTTREVARAHGLKPLFTIQSYAVAAVDNEWMGEGPSVGLPIALERAGMQLQDLDFIEINEAFAGMVLANERLLRWDRARLNVHGGAIALGHPVGCSGSRILVTLYHILKQHNGEVGGAAIGAAGGVTAAVLIRREN